MMQTDFLGSPVKMMEWLKTDQAQRETGVDPQFSCSNHPEHHVSMKQLSSVFATYFTYVLYLQRSLTFFIVFFFVFFGSE